MEAEVQKRLIGYLRGKGCYVIKTQSNVRGAIPVGCPDVFAFYEGWWGAFEVKASKKAPYQPLQEVTLKKLGDWSHARTVYPENYDEIIAELDMIL